MCTIGSAGRGLAWPSAIWLTAHQSAHLCHGTHAFVGQANEVVQRQFAQEGAVLAQADTPTKQWGPRVTSVELTGHAESQRTERCNTCCIVATRVASSPHRMPNRNAWVQECWSSRAAWARDGWRVRAQRDVGQLGAAAEHERLERGARRRDRAHAGVADVPAALERQLPVCAARFRDCGNGRPAGDSLQFP